MEKKNIKTINLKKDIQLSSDFRRIGIYVFLILIFTSCSRKLYFDEEPCGYIKIRELYRYRYSEIDTNVFGYTFCANYIIQKKRYWKDKIVYRGERNIDLFFEDTNKIVIYENNIVSDTIFISKDSSSHFKDPFASPSKFLNNSEHRFKMKSSKYITGNAIMYINGIFIIEFTTSDYKNYYGVFRRNKYFLHN